MNARPADRLAIALAQLNPTVGDVAGNAEKVRRARAEAAAHGADLVVFPELFISGYPPEDLVLKPAFQAACRAAVEAAGARDRRRRPGAAGRHALGRGRQALQRRGAARRRRDRGAALQGRSAELRRVRREARVRAGPAAGPGEFPRRAHRHSDLRGHLGPGSRSSASPRPAAKFCWCRTARPTGAASIDERLNIAVARVVEAGLPLIYLNRSAARTSWCSTAPRSCSTPTARSRSSFRRSARRSSPRDWVRAGGRLALRRAARSLRQDEGDQADYARLRAGPARLRRQERLSGRGARPVRRRRFRALRRDGGRCAGRRARALRDAALLASPRRNRSTTPRPAPRRSASATTSCRSRPRSRASSRRSSRCSPACRATSPRRTCRRARAAPS